VEGPIEGLASKVYAFATKRSRFIRDIHSMVAEEALKKVSAGVILDVGTGPGYLPIKMASENPHLRVIGIDVSDDMVRIARRNVEKAGLENVEVLAEDVVNISLIDESVDLALATMSLHHWLDPVKALNELHRVLKHGCELWIYEVDRHPTLQSEGWMKRRYNIILRLIIDVVRRHSSITVEHAESILGDLDDRFAQHRVGRLEPPLIKMVLSKGSAMCGMRDTHLTS